MDGIENTNIAERVIRAVVKRVAQQPPHHYQNREDNPLTVLSRLVDDCQLDSLGCMELVMDIEDEFKVHITDCQASELNTIGEMVEAIKRALIAPPKV